jgi:ketosteroid isomerase-like protein
MVRQEIDIRQIIVSTDEAFCAAFNRGDAVGVAAFYAVGATLLPTGSHAVERPGIQAFWQAVMNSGITSVELKLYEVERGVSSSTRSASTCWARPAAKWPTAASTW